MQENVAADPAGSPSRRCEWRPNLDYISHEEVFRDDEQISYSLIRQIIQQDKIWIRLTVETFAHGTKCAICNFVSELRFLTFQLKLLAASWTVKIGHRLVAWGSVQVVMSAIWTKRLSGRPSFG
jgi:hypothetical protein